MPVIESDPDAVQEKLKDAGIVITNPNTEYERWRAKHGGATAVAYDDKVVVQGSNPYAILAIIGESSGRVHLYFDGACRGNPGPAAIGWVLVTDEGIVAEGGERIGDSTNNRAEYDALIRGLEVARSYGFEEIDIRGDSELVTNQVRGEWNVNNPELLERRVRVLNLLEAFDNWSISHVPRDVNQRADVLANEALDT